ncbi:MAG: signal recognition particle protein [Candidatus Eisenbacteria bacterium]|nr:signal recognition particle protein [Candidatus Eisenbacteria bacterium]
MFEQLSERFQSAFRSLTGKGRLSEANIEEALREVRRALLEADVNFKVARGFVEDVKARAIGEDVLKSVTPGQQVIKIVHDELTALLGGRADTFRIPQGNPAVIMVVGLQGSGKTTFCAKLAKFLRQRGRRPMLAAADTYRPAAQEQLATLGRQLGLPVHVGRPGADPVAIAESALRDARETGADTVVLDTAGRLHVDDEMMSELERIRERTRPQEILLVLDSMTGQDAVNVASEFARRLEFSGAVLTKLDGDTRGGAAVSLRAVTGKPIKFAGVGEKLDALESFHPDRMASRILGMGDVVTLVERAQAATDLDEAAKLEEKIRKESLTLEDFFEQLQALKKMGPLDQLVGMMPGANKFGRLSVDETALVRIEAIINSMTREERRNPGVIDGSRRRRIAAGSGTTVQDINRLLKQFDAMKKMAKQFGKLGRRGKLPGMSPLGM